MSNLTSQEKNLVKYGLKLALKRSCDNYNGDIEEIANNYHGDQGREMISGRTQETILLIKLCQKLGVNIEDL